MSEAGARERRIYAGGYRVDVVVRPAVAPPVPAGALGRLAATALAATDAPRPSSLAVILSGDEELAALNVRHMGHEGPTDVLSFPLLRPSAFGRHVAVRGQRNVPEHDFVLPPGRRVHLGDIVLSVERARAQARSGTGGQTGRVGWTDADEVRLLVVHGVLHVCGWDHAEPTEEAAMRALERDVLGLGAGPDPRDG